MKSYMEGKEAQKMVEAWFAEVTPLYDPGIYMEYYGKVPEFRRQKADGLRFREDRALSIGAWALWMHVKETRELGEDTVFNLSHSGRYVMCAYSDRQGEEVGCDLEVIREFKDRVAQRFYCPEEYAYIIGKDEAERAEWFYRFWVLKESFLKATRRGMELDTRSFRIEWTEEGQPFLAGQPEAHPRRYTYAEYRKEGVDAAMAVCSTDGQIDRRLQEWKFAE